MIPVQHKVIAQKTPPGQAKSFSVLRQFGNWVVQDDDPNLRAFGCIRYRTMLTAITLRMGIDVLSQLTLGNGHLEWGRTLSSLVVMPFEVHYMPIAWRLLDQHLLPFAPLANPSNWELTSITRSRLYTRYWLPRAAIRAYFNYAFLYIPVAAMFEISATLALQQWSGANTADGLNFAFEILSRLKPFFIGGLFWPLFGIFNLHHTPSAALRTRNGMIMEIPWNIISTATASGALVPLWAKVLPYAVSLMLIAKTYWDPKITSHSKAD